MNEEGKKTIDFGIIEDQSQNIIKVVGVGGGGQNAVRNMYNEGIEGVTFAVCNTDSAALTKSPVPVKLQLGTVGLGAGANPEVGKKEAQSNIQDIERLLDDGTKMVFIAAGMGGGTGTGAAPVVAKVAKEKGLLTIGVVTIPFYFEQKRKIMKALRGVDELRKYVDAMLIVNNERICDIYSNTNVTLQEALRRADDILKNAVKGISELITISTDGDINLDFRDVETTMRNGGGAIMAIGRASGERRVQRAILDAIDSPLLFGNDIGKAKRILFNIYASEESPLFVPELSEISDFFDQLDPEIDVIWGTATDNSLGEDAKVIILAADMDDDDGQNEHERRKEDDKTYYEDLISKLYKPMRKNEVSEPKNGGNLDENSIEKPVEEPKLTVVVTNHEESNRVEDEKSTENEIEAPKSMENKAEKADEIEKSSENEIQDSDETEISSENEVETKPTPIVERWKQWLERKITEVVTD